jgi:DUF4097 and DUF4098 domain-containing protein YvlB
MAVVGGCVINFGGCCGGWTEEKYERVVQLSEPFSADGSFEAETHNGSIEIAGGDVADCNVTATIVGQAMNTEDARKIAEETKVKLERFGNKLTAKIDRPALANNQSVSVSFNVKLPRRSDLELKTHNGEITIKNTVGKIDATTHNGRVVCSEVSGDMKLKSHNGRIEAAYAKDAPGICNAEAVTHNGGIEFTAPANLSARAEVKTHNGSINTELPIEVLGKISRRKIAGKIGTGDGQLYLETHNGSIKIKEQK